MIKLRFIFVVLSAIVSLYAPAQKDTMTLKDRNAMIQLPVFPDSVFTTYYHQRVTHFRTLPQTKDDIIFLGNSITDGAEWSELFNDLHIKNRGVSGDITAGVIHRLDEIVKRRPKKIFLLIGINDLAKGIAVDSVLKNILLVSDYVHQQSVSSQLYVQSILPVNNAFGKFVTHTKNGELIKQLNATLQANAAAHHYLFIDLNNAFSNKDGKLKETFTNDGLHLKGEAYLLWKHLVYPFVYDLLPKPSILPLPQQLKWGEGYFPLFNCKSILVKNVAFKGEAYKLQNLLAAKGLSADIVSIQIAADPVIELRFDPLQKGEEMYKLEVTANRITVSGSTAHGIFNGIQTLDQLMRDGSFVDACEIKDWPAFSWRGYMVDAARNYQSIQLLKQQIEIMSKYKLNIFHFHITEDIAWRLAVKQYPQLTAPESMLRNKGLYYSEADMNELIRFCKERYITLIPEIDMPGHSAAFTRAMKTDMQSDSGMVIVKNILKEFCATYDLPYIHMGGDEVKISNKNFLPEMIMLLHQLGKQTIGWSPGGNIDDQTIRQLWMSDLGDKDSTIQSFIDSRHLYINHMDPLESVVTIFNRMIGDQEKETTKMKGAILCLWPDRRVEHEDDVLKMNPVYPAMLAFAERTWKGGGTKGWVAGIGEPGSQSAKQFTQFENRLLDQEQYNFKQFSFPYAKQSDLIWNLYGPYKNNGELSKQFEPEKKNFDESKPSFKTVGGTIILRHWWAPLIKGAIVNPEENTTWYAVTKIWSNEDAVKECWIGFNNLSRSPATDSPPVNEWDTKQSKVWVNGILISSPEWKRGGQKGNAEIPLVDEGYEYRAGTKIQLKKGWNTVLIKAPVGSFKGKDWQNPVKWMFSFVNKIN